MKKIALCFMFLFVLCFNQVGIYNKIQTVPPKPSTGLILKVTCVYSTVDSIPCTTTVAKNTRVIVLDNLKVPRVKIQYVFNKKTIIGWVKRADITVLKHIQ